MATRSSMKVVGLGDPVTDYAIEVSHGARRRRTGGGGGAARRTPPERCAHQHHALPNGEARIGAARTRLPNGDDAP
jgi:hypothetical protein